MTSILSLRPDPIQAQISANLRVRTACRLLATPLLALTTVAFAQGPAMSSASEVIAAPYATLTGRVLDPTRAIIPGATVELKRVTGGIVSSAVTDSSGHFQFAQPVPGDYRLSVVLPGFTPLDRALHVTRSPLAPLTLIMGVAGVVTNVTVNGDEDKLASAPENNGDAAAVSSEDMKNLPIFDGDIVATLSAFLDAGVSGEGGPTLMVDGVESNSVGVAPSAIERVSINQDPYSAQYRSPGRGQVEIITKATADHFHGSASFTFRDSALNASNYFATSKPPEQRRIYEGFLTGPIKPLPNTAFLFSATRKEEDGTNEVLAATLPTPIPAQSIFAPTRSTDLTMKVSNQYGDHHSAYVLYRFHDSSNTNQTVGGLVQATAGYVAHEFDMDIAYHDDLTISNNKLNQLNVRFERNLDRDVSDVQSPQVVVEGVSTFGGAQVDSYATENNPDVTDMFSWTLSKPIAQQLKFGLQITNTGRRVLDDLSNRQGTYTFADAAAYTAHTPSSFSLQQGQSRFQTLFATPSAFFMDEIQATKRLTITPGVRYDFQNTLSNTKDGVEPRLSLAFLVDKEHALVIRTGGGIFIRRVGVNIGQQIARYEHATEVSLLNTNNPCVPIAGIMCDPTAGQVPSLFTYQPGLQAPVQAYFSLSVERQLTKNSTITLSYNGYRGWHALRSVDVNAPLPPFTSAARPNPNFAQVLQLQSGAYQKTDGMNFSYTGRIGKVFSGVLQYYLQHADASTTFSTFIPQNQYRPNDEWSRGDFDQRQRLALFGTLYPDKPITLGLGFYNDTPMPYTITTGTDDYHTGLFNARPAGVPRNSLNGGSFQDVQLRLNYTRKLRPQVKDGNPTSVLFTRQRGSHPTHNLRNNSHGPCMNFAPIDWIIIAAYLAASMLIGLAGRKYVGGTADFLVAGRELGTAIGIATLAATEIGTITFMYNSELGYCYGFAAFAAALISGAAMIFVGRTGFVIHKFRALRLMTVPEYFETRYSSGLRLLTGILVAAGGVLNMGVFLKIEGQFLVVVGGLNPHSLILIMLAILLLELVYTTVGGMVSVVITDYMQYVLLSIASIVITVYAVHFAGWHSMIAKVSHELGSNGFNPFTSPKFGWQFLIWQVLLWLAVNTCWQTTAMRIFSTKSPETSRRVMTWTGFIFLGRGILPMLWGIAALTLFGIGHRVAGITQPVVHGQTLTPIEAMPAMLSVLLGPGIRGLVVAGMLAATMSVNSSYLLGWSAVISQDIIAPVRKAAGRPALSDRSQLFVNRWCNLAVGLFLIFWGLYYTPPGAVYLYLNVTGTIFLAGGFVCVVGGLYWKRANVLGGYLAMLLGAVGAIVPFFFLHRSESFSGFAAFTLAGLGLMAGAIFAKWRRAPALQVSATVETT